MDKVFNDTYSDGLCDLVMYYAGLPNIMELLRTCPSIVSPIEGFYQVLVNKGELEPIESSNKITRAIYLMEKILEK